MSRRGVLLSAVTAAAALAVFALLPPVPQWPEYHRFADTRSLAGIPHFADVVSNLPFTLLGLVGLRLLARGRLVLADARERGPWAVFFAGLVLLGPASAFYHWAPDDARLALDRLAMGIVFAGWFAVQIADRAGPAAAAGLMPVLVLAAVAAVAYWYAGERAGAGDLRPWGFVQFYPVLATALLFRLYPPRYTRAGRVWLVFALYGLALVAEALDRPVFAFTAVVSGHTLKHLLAAGAAGVALTMACTRCPLPRAISSAARSTCG